MHMITIMANEKTSQVAALLLLSHFFVDRYNKVLDILKRDSLHSLFFCIKLEVKLSSEQRLQSVSLYGNCFIDYNLFRDLS